MVNKITKESDRNYYEKIVTWKSDFKYYKLALIWGFTFLLYLSVSIPFLFSNEDVACTFDDNCEKSIHPLIEFYFFMTVIITIVAVVGLIICFAGFIGFMQTIEKKVKFRRIKDN